MLFDRGFGISCQCYICLELVQFDISPQRKYYKLIRINML